MTDLPSLPPRLPNSHKGDFGRALLIGGSRGMSGAIALAGMATLRSGAGLVTLAVPASCLDVVAGFEPSYMTVPLPQDEAGRLTMAAREQLLELATSATCVACGPGLARSPELVELVGALFVSISAPMVLDADALNALAARPEVLTSAGGPRVLTPHPGEFARLIGTAHKPARDAAERAAEKMAQDARLVILLKGHRTFITDGRQAAHNTTGNPGMATGGSGDVLTGIITALICQGLSPFDAARLGAHVHGLAGDLAAAEVGQVSLIASDLVRFLPSAFQRLYSAP